MHYDNWDPSSGYEKTHLLMKLAEPPDGIFCANDLMALGCIKALKEHGKSIPKDGCSRFHLTPHFVFIAKDTDVDRLSVLAPQHRHDDWATPGIQ